MKKYLYLFLGIFLIFLSCTKPHAEEGPLPDNSEKMIVLDSVETDDEELDFDIFRFKTQLDSLISKSEYKGFQFHLNIDTINEQSDPRAFWHFKKEGLFYLLDYKKADQIILYHFLDPKTSKILRIYLTEAVYSDPEELNAIHQSFLTGKETIESWGEIGMVIKGLTYLNDFVIILENKIYWMNISCQYSKKNVDKIIELLKNNLDEKNYIDTIKCYCGKGCE